VAGTVHHLSQVRADPASLETASSAFLVNLEQAGRSPHTRRAYASDLAQLVAATTVTLPELTPEVLRNFFASQDQLAVSTRARRQASVASFCAWAYREGLLASDPMGRVMRIRTEQPPPRGFTPAQVTALLAAIPTDRLRDRVLFTLMATTGLRIGEALSLHIDDIQLQRDDERLTVLGKGERHRTVLLDDPTLLRLLRRYLRETGYRHGPLFRAERGTASSPLRYQSVQTRFVGYAQAASVSGSLHDLRHAHAQALVNGGVSLATIRKRLGHANINTTLRYAEQSDAAADSELRHWQRTRSH
jgi:site-specific recombinase XerD